MPGALTQVQDAAQQVLARLNRIDIDKLSNQLNSVLADLHDEMATGDVRLPCRRPLACCAPRTIR